MIGQLAAVFNIAVCIGIPLGALVWLALRRRTGVKVFLLGAAGFFVSQMLVRQPLLALLGQTDGYRLFTAAHPVAQALFLALTAGLAEETARYLVFCLLARNKQPERGTPLWYGLGHGGLEAVLVGLNSVVLLAAAPETLAAAGGSVALAGVERIAAMMAQVALSFVAYCALRHRGFLLWAILLHGLYDFCIVLQLLGLTPLALEGVMMVFSLLLLAGAVRLWKGGRLHKKAQGVAGLLLAGALVAVAVPAAATARGGTLPGWAEAGAVQAQAREVIGLMNAGDYEGVAARCTDPNATAELFRQGGATVTAMGGFQGYGGAVYAAGMLPDGRQYAMVYQVADYEYGKLTYTVNLLEDGSVTGFFVRA